MIKYIFKNILINILIYSETVLSSQDKIEILQLYHESLLGGYLCETKTLKQIGSQIQ